MTGALSLKKRGSETIPSVLLPRQRATSSTKFFEPT